MINANRMTANLVVVLMALYTSDTSAKPQSLLLLSIAISHALKNLSDRIATGVPWHLPMNAPVLVFI